MKRIVLLLAVAVLALLYITWPRTLPQGILTAHEPDTANGERMFHAGGCASCHASGDDTVPLLGGGLEIDSPYGVFRVPNISPDPEFGIGAWTLLEFVNAMKMGVSRDGHHYYPAFPYASYTRMRVEDIVDLKAYLDTLPAIQTRNREHSLAFPWNIRAGIGLWKLLNLDAGPVVSGLPDDAETRRGQYLVEGPGHCGECHTPRDWTGGLRTNRWLAGAPDPGGEGRVPNITPAGLQDWSKSDIAYYLQSGFTPDFDTVGGSMVEVQENMAKLPAEDLEAIGAYLEAIPALD
ncbi:MAG: cytochrome c [Xanthomonadales bacterium]|nr:cytochrome c [Xanthomonadales bacterium]